jgi:acyl-CoA thioesterase
MTSQTLEQPQNPQALAEAVAQAMWARDHAAQALGIRIESVGPGQSSLLMDVRQDMLNGHDMCHGGMIFALADTAFAYACNAYNQTTVASACNIDYLAPARQGDTLRAKASERSLAGRTGVYDIVVEDTQGRQIALFRGKSHRIAGEVIASVQRT